MTSEILILHGTPGRTVASVRKVTRMPVVLTRLVSALGMACVLFSPVAAGADVVLDWNAIAVSTMLGQIPAPNPFSQARFMAITQLAVFEAVNAVTGKYQPYLGTIHAPEDASADAAAIAAAHAVLLNYFPGSATALNDARASSLATIPNGQAKDDGIATGEAAAAAMILLRANDGSAPAQFFVPGSPGPGVWEATPSCPTVGGIQVGILLQWRNVTPFGIGSAGDFLLDPPPSLRSSRYRKDYIEVMTVGGVNSTERPQDRADVARFYAASSPSFLLNLAARQVAVDQGRSLSHNARALALINMAISDSLVASFLTKYHYNFWRPETAIRLGDTDGNPKTDPDPAFAPFILTPCFPSYPSNHASGSNGGTEMLRRLYGAGGHDITLVNALVPGVTLHYTSFKQITDDVDDARVYGGIHFRFDQEAGGRLGRGVATYIYKHNLRQKHDPADDDDDQE
jgi:hypothetical protein